MEVVGQVTALAPEYRRLPEYVTTGPTWTHALRSPNPGLGEPVRLLLDVLTQVVSLPSPPDAEFALALDWYKNPEGIDPYEWPNTTTAELVSSGKYRYKNNNDMQSQVGLRACRSHVQRYRTARYPNSGNGGTRHPGTRHYSGSLSDRASPRLLPSRRGIPIVKVRREIGAFRPEAKESSPNTNV